MGCDKQNWARYISWLSAIRGRTHLVNMVIGDDKLPVKHTFTRKGDAAYDSMLEVTGADGKPAMWEEESCKKVRGVKVTTPSP